MGANPQTKRAFWHDYCAAGRYMITLSKAEGVAPFCRIDGDWRLPVGTRGSSYTRWSPIGRIIADRLYRIGEIHPALRTEQYVVMPDHVHFLLWVQSVLPEPLGLYVARFKNAINVVASKTHVFEDGFNDQIVTNKRNLNTIFNYIRSNPYRLAVRYACPDFFTKRNDLTIGDMQCQFYGNLHLLDNPFKDQVIVHRADDEATFRANKERWLYTAANGGVLVSPFISPREKAVRNDAYAIGGRVIQITNRPLAEKEKPVGNDFELCARGRMLRVAPTTPMAMDRACCLKLNSLAQILSETCCTDYQPLHND